MPKDPNPQWRRVAWSHDCTLLAFADSTGTVRLFDLMGSELFVIPPVTAPRPPPSEALFHAVLIVCARLRLQLRVLQGQESAVAASVDLKGEHLLDHI